MFNSKLLTGLACLATAANGLSFWIQDFTAPENLYPTFNQTIEFSISNPDATISQGGNSSASCALEWDSEAPTCWTQCGSSGYFFRVTPGSYNGAANMSLDLFEEFVDEFPQGFNTTLQLSSSSTPGYTCATKDDPQLQGFLCTLGTGEGYNQTVQSVNPNDRGSTC